MNPYRTSAYNPGTVERPSRWYQRRMPAWLGALSILCVASGVQAQTKPLRLNGVLFGPSDNTVWAPIGAAGCKGDGVADCTAAFQAAASSLVAGNTFMIPAGTFLLTDTVTISANYVHIVGAGTAATTIKFNPGSAKPAIKFSAGASVIYGDSITGMTFVSTGSNTQTKTAIQASDTSGLLISDVWVDPQNSSTWTGTGSIGIQLKGREQTTIQRVRIFADKPFEISANPNSSSIGCDHLHVQDVLFRPTPSTGGSAILIDDGVILTNVNFDGFQSWIVDKYGLSWTETGGTSAVAQNIAISGVRCEQAVDATGFCIYVDHIKGIQNLDVRDAQMSTSPAQNGMHFKGVTNLAIRNSIFGVNDATKKHLDITGSVKDLWLEGNYFQVNTTATLTGLTLVLALPQVQSAAVLPPTGWYSDSTTASTIALTFGASAIAPSFANGLSLASGKPITFGDATTQTTAPTLATAYSSGAAGPQTLALDSTRKGVLIKDNATPIATPALSVQTNAGSTLFDISNGTSSDHIKCNLGSGSDCFIHDTTATWSTGNFDVWNNNGVKTATLTYAGIPTTVVGGSLSSATTIAPINYITHITGTTTIQTITAPNGCAVSTMGCHIILVFDGVAPWNAVGNILVAGTPTTVGTTVMFTYDNATSKWYPSRTL